MTLEELQLKVVKITRTTFQVSYKGKFQVYRWLLQPEYEMTGVDDVNMHFSVPVCSAVTLEHAIGMAITHCLERKDW